MEVHIPPKERKFLGRTIGGVFVLLCFIWIFFPSFLLFVTMFCGLTTIIVLLIEYHYRRENDTRQLEALMTVHSSIDCRAPLPSTAGWAASPELLSLLLTNIHHCKPKLVVELGSGVSTLVIGYYLEKLGMGKLISFDHDQCFADKTRNQIIDHGLEHVVRVEDAPIVEQMIEMKRVKWYSANFKDLLGGERIDLLVVDGPPGKLQPMSRYPAFPQLGPFLNDDCVIVLDDGGRRDERLIANAWQQTDPRFSVAFVPIKKGAFVLKRLRNEKSDNMS